MRLFDNGEGLRRGQIRYGNSLSNEWDESKHPRGDDGKFGAGGGGSAKPEGKGSKSEKKGGDKKPEVAFETIKETVRGKLSKDKFSGWTENEVIDGLHVLYGDRERLADDYFAAEKAGKKTVKAKKLKEMQAIDRRTTWIKEKLLGEKGSPDQKDFDRMDKEGDTEKRSKAWSR